MRQQGTGDYSPFIFFPFPVRRIMRCPGWWIGGGSSFSSGEIGSGPPTTGEAPRSSINRKQPRARASSCQIWGNILGKSPQQVLVPRSAIWGGESSEESVVGPLVFLRCRSPLGSNGRLGEELGVD